MDVAGFLRRSHVLVVAGKGGVGKTTVSAALATLAAGYGLDVLLVALDERDGLGKLFDYPGEIGYEPALLRPGRAAGDEGPVPGRVRARLVTSNAALLDYLEGHGLRRLLSRLVKAGALDVVSTAVPGIREVLVLGKVRQLEESGEAELIVLDAPASGHALSMLQSSGGFVDLARAGPLREQAEAVVAMLADPHRSEVLLVTLAEEMPVNEAAETAYRLEDEVGVAIGPVVVNACYPHLSHLDTAPDEAAREAEVAEPSVEAAARLSEAAAFRKHREQLQRAEIDRLSELLPLGRIELPYLFSAEIGPEEVAALAAALEDQVRGLR